MAARRRNLGKTGWSPIREEKRGGDGAVQALAELWVVSFFFFCRGGSPAGPIYRRRGRFEAVGFFPPAAGYFPALACELELGDAPYVALDASVFVRRSGEVGAA